MTPCGRAVKLLAVLALLSCREPPREAFDAGPVTADGAHPAVRLVWDRTLDVAGESPGHLLVAGERLLAITDRAAHLLDDEGRALWRAPLPGSPGGALVTSAASDGAGFGATLRWTDPGSAVAAGTYFARSDAVGRLSPATFERLTAVAGVARVDWDGQGYLALHASPTGGELELRADRFVVGAGVDSRRLQGGLSLELRLGGVAARPQVALCTVEPDGDVTLRRYAASGAPSLAPHLAAQQRTVGHCQLAASERSWLVGFTVAAAVRRPDAGSGDGGLMALSFDVPAAQLVTADGRVLPAPARLSALPGVVRIETMIWDGRRYLVLLNAPGLRGGRLALTVVDEQGQSRCDLTIPLRYEPGQLGAAQLALVDRALYLLYASRLPWDDEPLLHLARLEIVDS